jgi:hypothetical protein
MVKEEDGAVTVSLYEDVPVASTTTETPTPEGKTEPDIKASTETSTATTEQSEEKIGTTGSSSSK